MVIELFTQRANSRFMNCAQWFSIQVHQKLYVSPYVNP
jgi:hypothetical protein